LIFPKKIEMGFPPFPGIFMNIFLQEILQNFAAHSSFRDSLQPKEQHHGVNWVSQGVTLDQQRIASSQQRWKSPEQSIQPNINIHWLNQSR